MVLAIFWHVQFKIGNIKRKELQKIVQKEGQVTKALFLLYDNFGIYFENETQETIVILY